MYISKVLKYANISKRASPSKLCKELIMTLAGEREVLVYLQKCNVISHTFMSHVLEILMTVSLSYVFNHVILGYDSTRFSLSGREYLGDVSHKKKNMAQGS